MLLLRFFSEKETETERATLLDFNHFENTDFSISCLPFSGSILRYYVKWIITLSHFHTSLLKLSFEPINFWFNWSHLFGSCQVWTFEVFFCHPFAFLLPRLVFSVLFIFLTTKLLVGILYFVLVLRTLYLFWSFLMFYFFFLSCVVFDSCAVLCYSLHLDKSVLFPTIGETH